MAGAPIRCSIVVSISACHAEDPGSIPGGGALFPSPPSACAETTSDAQQFATCRKLASVHLGAPFPGFVASFCVGNSSSARLERGELLKGVALWPNFTPCGTRTRNLRIRSPTPCPLGHGGMCCSRSVYVFLVGVVVLFVLFGARASALPAVYATSLLSSVGRACAS